MIKQENIDIRVQQELFKKRDSLNKLGRNSNLNSPNGTKFFIGDILDVSEENIKLEKNIVEFVCKGFYNTLSSLRSRYTFSKKIKPLGIKLIKTIDKILKIKWQRICLNQLKLA